MGRISYLEFSNRDCKYAHDMFTLENYNPCARFCQQSVEKRFKHYVELVGSPEDTLFLSTHNLRRLYERVCQIAGADITRERQSEMAILTENYDVNYPKDINLEVTKEMAEEAIEIMKNVNAWIDALLEKSPEDLTPEAPPPASV